MRHPNVPQIGRHYTVGGNLAPGTVVSAGATVKETIPVFGLLRGRVRGKMTTDGGTLAFKYVKPVASAEPDHEFPLDGSSVIASDNPTSLTLSTTETSREIEFFGEVYLSLEYTDDGDGSTIEQIQFSGI